jgi:zona occludens toxin (predicted ATPase)
LISLGNAGFSIRVAFGGSSMRFLTLIAAIALVFSMSSGAMAGNCVKAGGQATMLTEDLAKFMAKAALKNQMKNEGFAPSGRLVLTCQPAALGTHCVARQRACK